MRNMSELLLKMTVHFQKRLSERGIKIKDVKSTLKDPDYVGKQEDGKEWAIKMFGKKSLKVVYCKEEFRDLKNHYLLITVYLIPQAE